MGFKAVTKKQNGQDVLVSFVDESAVEAVGADLHPTVFESTATVEPSADIMAFVSKNSYRSFNLYKVVDEQIVCRTIEELEASEWMEWSYSFKTQADIDAEQEEELEELEEE
jgi:hypothetical protein